MLAPKIARSHSEDPVQEHLRERKAAWNEACREFIAHLNMFKPHLIAFKRGLNGRGDQKAGLPISDIKNPFPPEIPNYLEGTSGTFSELTSFFSKLMTEAAGIVQEQADYAAKRRQPHQEVRQNPQQARRVASVIEEQLIVQGSNSFTRFWAHFSSMLSGKAFHRVRLSALVMSHSFFKKLVDLEDILLEKDLSNVPKIISIFSSLWAQMEVLRRELLRMKELAITPSSSPSSEKEESPPKPSDFEGPPEPPPGYYFEGPPEPPRPSSEEGIPRPPRKRGRPAKPKPSAPVVTTRPLTPMEKIYNDATNATSLGLSTEERKPIINLFGELKREPEIAPLIEGRIFEEYDKILQIVKTRLEEKYSITIPHDVKFHELYKLKEYQDKLAEAWMQETSIVKEAGALARLLNKYKHRYGLKDATSAARMDAYEGIDVVKKDIDTLMDLLEKKQASVTELEKKYLAMEKHLMEVKQSIKILSIMYKNHQFENMKKDDKRPTSDPVSHYFTKQIRRDFDKSRF